MPGVPANWSTSINNARLQWDDSRVNTFISPYGSSSLNYNTPVTGSVPFAYKMYYSDFPNLGYPNNVPGATINGAGATHSTSTMWFNDNFTWNFVGTMSQSQMKADVHTVVMHEMGHSSGLNHPDVCGAMTSSEVAASMNPNWTKKWTINSDDAWGIQSRY
jgi:hypothetical protein